MKLRYTIAGLMSLCGVLMIWNAVQGTNDPELNRKIRLLAGSLQLIAGLGFLILGKIDRTKSD